MVIRRKREGERERDEFWGVITKRGEEETEREEAMVVIDKKMKNYFLFYILIDNLLK